MAIYTSQVSKLKNGLLVASVENHSPVSRVAVVYNGGSRSETHDNLGISHCLRNAAHLVSLGFVTVFSAPVVFLIVLVLFIEPLTKPYYEPTPQYV